MLHRRVKISQCNIFARYCNIFVRATLPSAVQMHHAAHREGAVQEKYCEKVKFTSNLPTNGTNVLYYRAVGVGRWVGRRAKNFRPSSNSRF